MDSEKIMIDYTSILADLEAKKAALEALIASVRAAASSGLLVMGEIPPGSSSPLPSGGSGAIDPADVPTGAFNGKSIPEAAKVYLLMVKKKQTTREIADALRRGGIETTSDNFLLTVHAGLNRNRRSTGDIVRIGKAWGLAEWYPASLRSGKSKTQTRKVGRMTKRKVVVKVATGSGKRKPKAAKPEEKKESLTKRVLALLRSQRGTEYASDQLAQTLHENVKVVQMLLPRLVKKHLIEKTGAGKYRANAKVQEMVAV